MTDISCMSIDGVCGVAKPPNADASTIFFPANMCQNVLLSTFGDKSWNYHFDAFHNFHNYPNVQPKRRLKSRAITGKNLPWIFICSSILASYSFGHKLVLDIVVIRIGILAILIVVITCCPSVCFSSSFNCCIKQIIDLIDRNFKASSSQVVLIEKAKSREVLSRDLKTISRTILSEELSRSRWDQDQTTGRATFVLNPMTIDGCGISSLPSRVFFLISGNH